MITHSHSLSHSYLFGRNRHVCTLIPEKLPWQSNYRIKSINLFFFLVSECDTACDKIQPSFPNIYAYVCLRPNLGLPMSGRNI